LIEESIMKPEWLDNLGEVNWDLLQQRTAALQKELEHLPQEAMTKSLETLAFLQAALERVREERSGLLKDYYGRARETFHFEELDLATLQAMAAGPVELLELE